MSKNRLSGPQLGKLSELLRAAFPIPNRFAEILLFRLDKQIANYASLNDDYPTMMYRVLVEANAKLWWQDLLREARNAIPQDPGLLDFAAQFGLSPRTLARTENGIVPIVGPQLELKIKQAQSSFDIHTWRKRLGEVEGQVCRIEYPEKEDRGTGFLVGPDVVMTNYHVIEEIHKGIVSPDNAVLRFDYKVLDDGVTVSSGKAYRLKTNSPEKKWLIDHSPYSQSDYQVNPAGDPEEDELDYALLRIDGVPGKDPVGGDTNDPSPTPRSWVEVPPIPHLFTRKNPALHIIQHPDGKPMQVTVDSEAFISVNGNGTRVRYSTETKPGSSGSPCFSANWRWIALHHAGDPKYWKGEMPEYNQGIPVSAILRLLKVRGLQHVLGSEP